MNTFSGPQAAYMEERVAKVAGDVRELARTVREPKDLEALAHAFDAFARQFLDEARARLAGG